jgi:hypothetical protein
MRVQTKKYFFSYCSWWLTVVGISWSGLAAPPAIPHLAQDLKDIDPIFQAYCESGSTITLTLRVLGKGCLLDGPLKITDPNGVHVATGVYSNSVPQGEWLTFHTNGVLSSRESYSNGKEQGVQMYFAENGVPLRLTTYKSGEKNGLERYWSPSGDLRSNAEWKGGLPVWLEFYEDGKTNRLTGESLIKYFRERALSEAKKLELENTK